MSHAPQAICTNCGREFAPTAGSTGGIVNCPGCGQATEVDGLDDPAWRLLQVGAVIAALLAGAIVGAVYGLLPGIGAGLAGLGGCWLASRAL